MRIAVFVVVLAGCPGRGPVDPTTTAAGPQLCEQMASHVVAVMDPAGAETGTIDAITRALGDHCVKDRWSLDAQQCFLDLASIEDSERCAPLLTIDQREGLAAALALVGEPATGAKP